MAAVEGRYMFHLHNNRALKEFRRELRNNATATERALWQVLKGKQLGGYKFRRQHSVGRYVIDFYCPAVRLAIEIDGPIHDSSKAWDGNRTAYLNTHGIDVLRFSNEDISFNLPQVLRAISDFILDKHHPLCPPPFQQKEGE